MKKHLLFWLLIIITSNVFAQEKISFNGYLKELTMYYKPVNPIPVSETDSLNSLLLNQFHNRLNFKWNATEKLVFDLEIRNRLFFGQMVKKFPDYEQMIDEMVATLGGRAAEEIVFGKISTGALNDLEKVTKQAYAMVAFYGLNKKIGNISYYDSSGQSEYSFSKPFSEETARIIDEEIHKMVEEAYNKAKQLLTENREKLNQLAEILLQKEVIFREDLEKIFGLRPFPDHDHVMINSNGDTKELKEAETAIAEHSTDLPAAGLPEDNDETANPKQEIPA